MEIESFFRILDSRLAEARQADRRKHERFFSELTPKLASARNLDREFDRYLARRFNVFDYLRTDERGLTSIIADLLNPQASHGQGPLFLWALLEKLGVLPLRYDLGECHVSVEVEHRIPSGRKIDLLARIDKPNGDVFCVAVENKPFAPDQNNQIKDYLKHLNSKYVERFLLLYFSPTGEGPSEQSLDPRGLEASWKDRFGIVPYHHSEESRPDAFDDFRFPFSLTDWLKECRTRCEIDRLRWFLYDVVLYCQRTFGERVMTTDGKTKTVRDFVLENSDNMKVAEAIYHSWPGIKVELYRTFLKRLKKKIENRMKDETDGVRIDCGDGTENWLSLYRDCWTGRTCEDGSVNRRTIIMEAEKKDANEWYIGISNPGNSKPNKLKKALARRLGSEKFEKNFPWYEWVSEDKRSWSALVPDLHEECSMEDGGTVTNYFVNRFVEVATEAIPVIDELEETKT